MSAGVDERRDLARSTATQTVLTAVSRVTGFVRVVVVAAVLGTTFLGNTYQSANTVPNIVFELFAAGALQAVLVPALVARFDRGDDEGAERLAGSVLGLTLALLGGLVVLGALASPLLTRALFSGVEDPGVRADQVALGTVFLLVFLPQILVYDVGLVATAVLHARGRFGLPAIAPAVNNVVVCAAYGTFWWLRRDEGPGLDLSVLEIAVLAGGTTLGVVAFCALPIVGAHRGGFRFRPNLDRSDPALRALARQGGWAALFLAMTQVLLGSVLLFANRAEGGVIVYQVGFTFFLLPHALFALPVLTTLFPSAARSFQAGRWDDVVAAVQRGTTAIALFLLPAAVALAVLAGPLARATLFGNVDVDGVEQIADVVRAFAVGLPAYALFQFLSRMLYAMHDTRTPAHVHAVVVAVGIAAMAVASATVEVDQVVPALAAAHSLTYLLGALALGEIVRRRFAAEGVSLAYRKALAPQAAAAVVAGAVGVGLTAVVPSGSRPAAILVVAGVGAAVAACHLVAQQAFGGLRPRVLLGLLRRSPTDAADPA